MIRERFAWELSTQPRTARIPHMVMVVAAIRTQRLKREMDAEKLIKMTTL